jgi:hypothetical protein
MSAIRWSIAATALAVPVLSLALAAAACSPGAATTPAAMDDPPTPTGPIDLVLLHTNDLWGETDPCG